MGGCLCKHSPRKEAKYTERDLPPDLYPEILSRLPVKSLLRFRCVSKPWLALVDSDADFARLHRNNFNNNRDQTRLFVEQLTRRSIRECVIQRSDTLESVTKKPFRLPGKGWHVVASLHGLILLRCISSKTDQFWDLKLWNPSIRKLIDVPPLRKKTIPLVVRRSLVGNGVGLGYDSVANTYKLVKIISANEVTVYVLGASSWKIIKFEDKLPNWDGGVYDLDKSVYFQGSLYFISPDVVWYLVQFDLSKEVFTYVRKPESANSGLNPWIPTLVSFEGFLCSQLTWDILNDKRDMKKNRNFVMSRRLSYPLVEVTFFNRETGECKTLQSETDFDCHVSCYVESLSMHNGMRSRTKSSFPSDQKAVL